MELFKKADKTFRVVLRSENRINGSTRHEPEFNIRVNYQEQYKFYNRCMLKMDSISIPSGELGDVAFQNSVMTVEYNGAQSNSYDSETDDMTSVVAILNTPAEIEDVNSASIGITDFKATYFPCEVTNVFGRVRFKLSEAINADYVLVYTLYFYKE